MSVKNQRLSDLLRVGDQTRGSAAPRKILLSSPLWMDELQSLFPSGELVLTRDDQPVNANEYDLAFVNIDGFLKCGGMGLAHIFDALKVGGLIAFSAENRIASSKLPYQWARNWLAQNYGYWERTEDYRFLGNATKESVEVLASRRSTAHEDYKNIYCHDIEVVLESDSKWHDVLVRASQQNDGAQWSFLALKLDEFVQSLCAEYLYLWDEHTFEWVLRSQLENIQTMLEENAQNA